ncbi:MAG: molybdopterin-synthase adenylyltransferase MoeB [Pseudomonadota bacterium]
MHDEQLLRYSRHIMLPEIDIAGQTRLLDATALIIGLGGLGSPAALYLAAAGVGKLILTDDDDVELSNLQRQIAHTLSRIGTNKAASAAAQIGEISPDTQVEVIAARLDGAALEAAVQRADIVLDCTDNFDSRYLINDVCWRVGKPLVSGAAIRLEGQISVFDPNDGASPCYRCLYAEGSDAALNCAENGVAAPLVGIIGTCQALEAMKYLAGIGSSLIGTILYFDGKYMEWRRLTLKPRDGCSTCGDQRQNA